MSRVVLIASIGAVIELGACVGLHAATDRAVGSSASVAAASYVAPARQAPVVVAPPPAAAPAALAADRTRHEWDRLASVDGGLCRQQLAELGALFRTLPDQPAPDAHGCGIPHGVLVQQGPTGIVYAPPLQIDCSLALELGGIERAIQDQAATHLGSAIKTVTTFGTYSCRNIRGGYSGKLSEHALGNAIDIGAFAPRKGRVIQVARDYRPGQDAPGEESLFLRGVFRALRQDGGLTYVIGPEDRADHHDHFHVDRAEPWWRPWHSGA